MLVCIILSSDLVFLSPPSSSFLSPSPSSLPHLPPLLLPPPSPSSVPLPPSFPPPSSSHLLPSPRSQGGLLWSVVPELLLDYQDYQQWLKDGGRVAGSAFHPESEEEFLEASKQAWTHLLMQIIKVSLIFSWLLYKWRDDISCHQTLSTYSV